MGQKKTTKMKKKKFPGDKDGGDRSVRPWPDLPQQLLNLIGRLIGRQSTLMQNISFGGITKSWRASSKRCDPIGKFPCLQLSNNNHNAGHNKTSSTYPHIFNISFRQDYYWYCRRQPPPYPWKYFGGYSYGELVGIGATPSDCYLWNPLEWYHHGTLPRWDTSIPLKYAVLSLWPHVRNTNTCMLVALTGISNPAFVCCRFARGDHGWIKHDCNIIDPHASNQSPQGQKQFMQFSNAIGFKGKVYALSWQGTLAVIEDNDTDSHPRITTLGPMRAVPSIPSKHFREYLVESNGEILLVFLISTKSVNVVDDLEVFGLNMARLTWVKMETLGNRTMFVGVNCCIVVSANKLVGWCRSNCVYFTNLNVDGWWVYDTERRSISSTTWSTNNFTTKSPDWNIELLERGNVRFPQSGVKYEL